MSLFIASLNSGSNGNCYYVGNDEEAVLIDAGISCRETEKRMKRLGLSMKKVKAIFVSHEHSDHISGIPVLSRRHHLPVYITDTTLRYSGLSLDEKLVVPFKRNHAITIGALTVHPFPKYHDAEDPHSFVVMSNGIKVGIFTDIGVVCEQVTHYFRQCNAVFLETNYDRQMLANGGYPAQLKKRISGGMGHLSNDEALDLFLSNRSSRLTHLLLSHLSRNNNRPEIVEQLFSPYAGPTKIAVASRYRESEVYEIPKVDNEEIVIEELQVRKTYMQLSMF